MVRGVELSEEGGESGGSAKLETRELDVRGDDVILRVDANKFEL